MGQQASVPKITDQDKAIFQLKQQRDKLKQYQKKLNVLVNKQSELAKKAVLNKEMDKAKFYLRSKKQQVATIQKTYDQLDNLENLINTIEYKLIEKDVLYGLNQGNKVLTKLNNDLKIENIDKILDDLEENKVKVNEISDLLGSNLTYSEEGEVEEEFERLDREINGARYSEEILQPGSLPNAPTEQPKEKVPAGISKKHSEESDKRANEPIAI